MSAVPKTPKLPLKFDEADCFVKYRQYSESDYLRIERQSETKHEFIRGYIHAMVGGNVVHHWIISNVFAALADRLKGKPCKVLGGELKVRLGEADDEPSHHLYPDLKVVCGPVDKGVDFITNPRFLFEVTSPSTRDHDYGEKLAAYKTMESLDSYFIIESETRKVVAFRRATAFAAETVDPKVGLVIEELDVTVPFAAIYEDTGL